MKPTNNISTCLWFDGQAEEAAKFYTSVFDNAEITAITHYDEPSAEASGNSEGSVMTVGFEIEGFSFMALNGGPQFKMNPSISFFVNCETKAEVNGLWEKLSQEGETLMPLDKYPFAARYGWVQDKFGVSWQLIFGDKPEGDWRPKIVPSLMFTGENVGKAEQAVEFYTSIFHNSKTGNLFPYQQDTGPAKKGALAFGDFMVENIWIAVMDSGVEQPFTFNEAVSMVVHCEDQDEIDDYWNKLSAVPEAEQCGWLKDQYGISWQIVPKNLAQLTTSEEVTKALMQMKKLDIRKLKKAANS